MSCPPFATSVLDAAEAASKHHRRDKQLVRMLGKRDVLFRSQALVRAMAYCSRKTLNTVRGSSMRAVWASDTVPYYLSTLLATETSFRAALTALCSPCCVLQGDSIAQCGAGIQLAYFLVSGFAILQTCSRAHGTTTKPPPPRKMTDPSAACGSPRQNPYSRAMPDTTSFGSPGGRRKEDIYDSVRGSAGIAFFPVLPLAVLHAGTIVGELELALRSPEFCFDYVAGW